MSETLPLEVSEALSKLRLYLHSPLLSHSTLYEAAFSFHPSLPDIPALFSEVLTLRPLLLGRLWLDDNGGLPFEELLPEVKEFINNFNASLSVPSQSAGEIHDGVLRAILVINQYIAKTCG